MSKTKELRNLAEKCSEILMDKYNVKRVYLIGSLAKGIVHERSDIDLVVEGLLPNLYMKALTELWDLLPGGVELNLIPFESAFDSLKEKTISEGRIIYGQRRAEERDFARTGKY